MDWESLGIARLIDNTVAVQVFGLTAVALVAWISLFVLRRILLAVLGRAAASSSIAWDDELVRSGVFFRLAHLAPALVVQNGLALIPDLNESVEIVLTRLASAAIALVVAMSISALLNAANAIYGSIPDYRNRPIKGYVQLFKLVIGVITAVVIVATLFDRSPLLFLSGLGAMTAVLLLVFKDTILSLVASVQLTTNDLIRVGDWVEMPQYDADGDVIDIALHTVRIQNWDKTITSIPTFKFIEGSFKNWRGMSLAGGRRIKRSLLIDVNSIRFLDDEEIERFGSFALLKDYMAEKRREIEAFNADPERDPAINADIRRLTNVGTFRAYVLAYLRNHPQIHERMTLIVRQLEPTPQGLPIEIYCFTNRTEWAIYEGIQSDIMDHLLAVARDFGLRAFQQPSGADLARLTGSEAQAS